jgi:glutathione S-transferase
MYDLQNPRRPVLALAAMKIYGHPLSPCTRKILLLAREKGAQIALQTIDLFAAEHCAPSYRALHPFGRVPVLEDEDFRLYESRAILRYLDARLPGPSLTPSDVRERARMEQWLSVDQSYVAPHTRALAVENVVRRAQGKTPDPTVVASARSALAETFEVLDAALVRSSYLVGPTPSLADLSLAPYLASLALLGGADLLSQRPHLVAYQQRLTERPGYAEVLLGTSAGVAHEGA